MEDLESGEHPNWAGMLEKDNLTGKDLYTLLDGVMSEQHKLIPHIRPANVSEEYWDPTVVSEVATWLD